MPVSLTIAQMEGRFPDLVKGQVYAGSTAEYRFRCLTNPRHPTYIQRFYQHHRTWGCPVCRDHDRPLHNKRSRSVALGHENRMKKHIAQTKGQLTEDGRWKITGLAIQIKRSTPFTGRFVQKQVKRRWAAEVENVVWPEIKGMVFLTYVGKILVPRHYLSRMLRPMFGSRKAQALGQSRYTYYKWWKSPEEFWQWRLNRNECCEICGKQENGRFHSVDHAHTKKPYCRGLLCQLCNWLISELETHGVNPKHWDKSIYWISGLVTRALDYLKYYSSHPRASRP